MSFQSLALFLLASILVTLSPGPDILTVITRSIAQGRNAGVIASLGFGTGLIFHTMAAAIGLSVFIAHSPRAQFVIRIAGAIYLLYIGAQLLFHRDAASLAPHRFTRRSLRSIYGHSILMNILNPKVILFFIAFFPQFTSPNSRLPLSMQFIVLGSLFTICSIFCFVWCAILSAKLASILKSSAIRYWGIVRALAALVLIGIAFKLAMDL